MRQHLASALSLVLAVALAQAMPLVGSWDLTFELLPTTRIYSSDITLNWQFAPGWRVESESKIYSDGLLRYQNFHLDGSLGAFDAWGKIYFHVQEARYRRAWLHMETPLEGGTLRLSFHHWARATEYTSGDRSTFGAWPCVEVVSWMDAWKFMGREVYVAGPVAGYAYAGAALTLSIGVDSPDPDRFQIYVPPASVAAFETAFGTQFWTSWVGRTVCVRGTIKGYRYTSGGPASGGYSVAEVSITSPSALSLGTCMGVAVSAGCPGTTIRWFEALNHVGQTVYVQGPVASITPSSGSPPGSYHGHSGYRVRLGGGAAVGNRVEVILPIHPGWSTVGTSYASEVCVHGTITVIDGVAVILPPNLISTSRNRCCTEGGLPGMFLSHRLRYTSAPWTITIDFGDCCWGFTLRQIAVRADSRPLCCGISYDAALSWAPVGLGTFALTLRGLPLLCCGITADLSVTYATDQKVVHLEPNWPGGRGCLSVYGDAVWTDNAWTGFQIYGWRIYCWLGDLRLEAGVALDRARMNSASPLSFRSAEWTYVGLAYRSASCCGSGNVWFNADFWLGDGPYLFGLRRVRLRLEVPVMAGLAVFTRGMIDQSKAHPLEYWNIGWKLSF
ncbi:MAG: hypothetical protein BIP78_0461 [Candidatus Bipolaricaulis sibiricus]|uniref:Uncharacterized protein n=1 Tax=Bipolaricaulis sibiricus TaxID=2501609 RepID=A0A410FT31_BIPS1|nr:MAG: hypothetical protein BIP78_0461 [Candidatus Bipolaricaulis sibiricus]